MLNSLEARLGPKHCNIPRTRGWVNILERKGKYWASSFRKKVEKKDYNPSAGRADGWHGAFNSGGQMTTWNSSTPNADIRDRSWCNVVWESLLSSLIDIYIQPVEIQRMGARYTSFSKVLPQKRCISLPFMSYWWVLIKWPFMMQGRWEMQSLWSSSQS